MTPLPSDDTIAFALGHAARDAVRLCGPGPVRGPATFFFRFEPDHGRLYPAGTRDGFFRPPFPERGPFAAGAVFADGVDRCTARFAAVDDLSRAAAEGLLRRWAVADDWELTIEAELAALPALSPSAARARVCTQCGLRRHVSSIALPYYGLQSFAHTRCDVCGTGRRLPLQVDRPG